MDQIQDFAEDRLSFRHAKESRLKIKVNGKPMTVRMYEAVYVKNPTNVAMVPTQGQPDQMLSIYVPEGASDRSPIIFFVKNHGWIVNSYALRHRVEDGKEYSGSSDRDLIGKAMADGYVLVTYGCRSRGDHPDAEGRYVSHAPATITDTKAVIRYLRYNRDLLPAGDTEHIIVTGTSGGGALSTIIGASGNNEEFYPSLYEIGAAGMEMQEGHLASTLRDDVYAVIAYCPIQDMREADAAYEYTYYPIRKRLVEEGLPVVDPQTGFTFQDPFSETYTPEWMLEAGVKLTAQYETYIDHLGLADAQGDAITGANLRDKMRELINLSLAKAYREIGIDRMLADLAGQAEYSDRKTTEHFHIGSENWKDFFSYDENGCPYLADTSALMDYLYFVARNQTLKVACAFSNRGLTENGLATVSGFCEDSLYGTTEQARSPFEFYSWEKDAGFIDGCGLQNTGLSFEEFLGTEAGRTLQSQLYMTGPIHYLLEEPSILTEHTHSDIAPCWYVRHGLRDRDTSFAVQTVLYHALRQNRDIQTLNFALAWLQPHCGDYDVNEAYTWLAECMNKYPAR